MNVAVLISALVCAALIGGLAILLRNLLGAESALPVTAAWIDDLSTERYLPMLRLLDLSDIKSLRSQPGYTAKMESRLRQQSCRIFRGYLRCLNLDFKRVTTALKVVMTQSGEDRPDLFAALVHQKIRFACGMAAILCRLFLYQRGIGCADVTSLLQIFDLMRIELRRVVPTTEIFA